MAQLKDVIITSTQSNNVKTFIRIGDTTPSTVDVTGSSIQFLQDLSSNDKSFDTAGNSSAFRIRHDTVGGYLVFQGRSGSNGPYQLMTLNDDTNTVTFGGVVSFEDIIFDQITGSHLYIQSSSNVLGTSSIQYLYVSTGSTLLGTTSIVSGNQSTDVFMDSFGNLIFQNTGSYVVFDGITMSFSKSGFTSTASMWYDGSQMHIEGFKIGNSWKSQYIITESLLYTNTYSIYTTSIQQQVQHYDYLSVFINGDILLQSQSNLTTWDYKPGNTSQSIIFKYNIPYVPGDDFYITYVYNGGNR